MLSWIKQHKFDLLLFALGSIGVIVAWADQMLDAFLDYRYTLVWWTLAAGFIGALLHAILSESSIRRTEIMAKRDVKLAQIEDEKSQREQQEKIKAAELEQKEQERAAEQARRIKYLQEEFNHMEKWLKVLFKALCTKPRVFFLGPGNYVDVKGAYPGLLPFVEYIILEECVTQLTPKDELRTLYENCRESFDLIRDEDVTAHKITSDVDDFSYLCCEAPFRWGWSEHDSSRYCLEDPPL